MINADRYRHTGRTYVNISGAPEEEVAQYPGAHARRVLLRAREWH